LLVVHDTMHATPTSRAIEPRHDAGNLAKTMRSPPQAVGPVGRVKAR
jgi:hypothetical protein